jgi:hypothetical protein
MGALDTYLVTIACPLDGIVEDVWQGKDGPCLFLKYREGASAPEDERAAGISMSDWRLPRHFGIHTDHDGHSLSAWGETDADGRWTATALDAVTATIPTGELVEDMDDGPYGPLRRIKQLRLWTADRGRDEQAIAELDAHHAEKAAALPAHGGQARCDRHDDPAPAVVWTGSFYLCGPCYESALGWPEYFSGPVLT